MCRMRFPLACCCAQCFCWKRISVFVDLALPRCRRACLGRAFLLCFTFSFSSSSSARDVQQRTWRVRCCLLEVGHRHVLDLAASHRLGHLYLSWHLWRHGSFRRNPDQLLKLFDIALTRSFQGVRISSGTSLLQTSRCKFRLLFALKSHDPCATERQRLVPKA